MLIPSVRKIHNHNSCKVIGHSFSFKMGGLISWESTLERDWLLNLEANPDIRTIVSQPQKFRVYHEGDWHRYTPDFQVEWLPELNRLPTIYEVKPDEIAKDPTWVDYFKSIRQLLTRLGYHFEVVTESQIRPEPQFCNIKSLRLYASVFVSPYERQQILAEITRSQRPSIDELLAALNRHDIVLPQVYRMLWDGDLAYEQQRPLTRATRLDVFKRGIQ